MATLVFTAIGSAVGGPVGGLIGSLLGQRIDNALFAPHRRREGPRLQELAVQTSSYGTQIPALFGVMRAAGSVIWATDLKEKRSSVSGGKGRPSTIKYSYSVSLAVALSSRPLLRVGRIWADGNLLRGADGSFKVATGFRLHTGNADQYPDPLIASIEGATHCPAFRGIAYAVFENLELADFGNRIPLLTFELFERDGSVSVAEICGYASGGLVGGAISNGVAGYAIQGPNARAAIAPLIDLSLLQCRASGDSLELYRPEESGVFAGDTRPVVTGRVQDPKLPSEFRSAARSQPHAVTLRYYDPARDYQAGVQRSGWSAGGDLEEQLELPAVLDTAAAQEMARNRASWRQSQRDRQKNAIATGQHKLQIGQRLGGSGMQVVSIEHFAGYAEIECERSGFMQVSPAITVDAGRHLPSPDEIPGQTLLFTAELPSAAASAATAPIVAIAAGGSGAGWRRAAISRKIDGELLDLGFIEMPSAIGTLMTPLALHESQLIDFQNSVAIRIDSNAQPPVFGSANPFAIDAPYMMLGQELIRCGSIEPLGNDMYRISDLMRGCGATTVSAHPAGTRLFFPDKERMLLPELPVSAVGTVLDIMAEGLGDSSAVEDQRAVTGLAIMPLAPVHGRCEAHPEGGLRFSWVRRARYDPGWLDGVDMPLVEAALLYEITVVSTAATLWAGQTTTESLVFDAAAVAAWSVPAGTTITALIRQIGDYGISTALTVEAQI